MRRPGIWMVATAGLVGTVAIIAGIFVLVGAMLLTHHHTWPLEEAYADVTLGLATRLHASQQQNPATNDRRALESGQYAFTGSCAICHGARGDGKGVFGSTLYPQATDLTSHDAKEKSDAALFWIVKNGLSFTGMPAFGDQYSDQDIWNLVTYMRALQNGRAQALAIPTPSIEQLALANPGGTIEQQGAAHYYAQGCQTCHGPVGNAPGELGLRRLRPDAAQTIRGGSAGMPAYGPEKLSNAEIDAIVAYLRTVTVSGARPAAQ